MIIIVFINQVLKSKLILQFQARQSLISRGLFPVLADPQHLVSYTLSIQFPKDLYCFIIFSLMILGWLDYMADFKDEERLC